MRKAWVAVVADRAATSSFSILVECILCDGGLRCGRKGRKRMAKTGCTVRCGQPCQVEAVLSTQMTEFSLAVKE